MNQNDHRTTKGKQEAERKARSRSRTHLVTETQSGWKALQGKHRPTIAAMAISTPEGVIKTFKEASTGNSPRAADPAKETQQLDDGFDAAGFQADDLDLEEALPPPQLGGGGGRTATPPPRRPTVQL